MKTITVRRRYVLAFFLLLGLTLLIIPAYINQYDSACDKIIPIHLNLTAEIRRDIEEHWPFHHRLPSSVVDLSNPLPETTTGTTIEVREGGQIAIQLGDTCARYEDHFIYQTPILKEGGELEWTCVTDIINQSNCITQ